MFSAIDNKEEERSPGTRRGGYLITIPKGMDASAFDLNMPCLCGMTEAQKEANGGMGWHEWGNGVA
ncbi:hypothetical protein Pmani_009629 [Petrolisthes manimaculis]|uniref:Uncharacterized protein n=1 Tax=Petrolisthes manimaculis TaxID=1843537 RepID=A0AAE1UI70_9EUCA|nr:hypothetical protein Pmani_009629 [Petrolisthes manimaculis]